MRIETRRHLVAEIKVIPSWAWVSAIAIFVSAQIFFNFFAWQTDGVPRWAAPILGAAAGIVGGCYLLFIGYISRDAMRRRMSALLWILVAVLIPHGLGIVLYFLLRQPLRGVCPQCANAIQEGSNFCPRCSYKLNPSCPQCQRAVDVEDAYCPHCATSLASAVR
jgi:double zinc ribbon protein